MQDYKTVATLSLVNAILGTILLVPILSSFLSFGGLTHAAVIVISILILVKARNHQDMRKISSVLMILASVLGIIIIIFFLGSLTGSLLSAGNSDTISDAQIGSIIGSGALALLSGVIAWIIRLVATIFYYIDYSKLSKLSQNKSEDL